MDGGEVVRDRKPVGITLPINIAADRRFGSAAANTPRCSILATLRCMKFFNALNDCRLKGMRQTHRIPHSEK